MRINLYTVEKENLLVKEKGINYPDELDNPKKIVEMFNHLFRLDQKAEEYVYMLALNSKNKPLGVFEVSHGTVNYSVIAPREIYQRALLIGASYIILLHNHPSGQPNPSKDDKDTTRRIHASGELLNVQLLDHIIVGSGSYFSFREESDIWQK